MTDLGAHNDNLEAIDDLGRTLMALAANAGQLEAVTDLAARDANLEAKDKRGKRPPGGLQEPST